MTRFWDGVDKDVFGPIDFLKLVFDTIYGSPAPLDSEN